MGYLALYRKYRPDNFGEVVGQEKIVKTISNAIENNKISHAYMFSGPRGTGKTTTAKIIAKMVNCNNLVNGKPCEKCESCINFSVSSDVVEIDAASNNGVDEIRELRDKVNLVPANSKYKIYIIDEVHMLTTQAFNALLKTLEEPPSHVIFILATTEPYKVPLTVASRCQKFQFSKINDSEIVSRLQLISEKENINIDLDALYEIARLSDGGLRDAINLLDQLSVYKVDNINLEDVCNVNGVVSYVEMYELLINVKLKKREKIINLVEEIDNKGKNISKFIEELIVFLKDVMIYKNSGIKTNIKEKNEKIIQISNDFNDYAIFSIINDLNDLMHKIKNSVYPSILLIVYFLKLTNSNTIKDNYSESVEMNKKEEEIYEEKNNNEVNTVNFQDEKNISREIFLDEETNINKMKKIRINNTFVNASKTYLNDIKKMWYKISDYLLDKKYELAVGLLVDTIPVVVGEANIILVSKYEASTLRINNNSKEIEKLLFEIYKKKYLIIALSLEEWENEKNEYINNLKKGYKYNYIEEEIEKIKEKEEDNVIKDSSVDKLINIVGEDFIEYI